MGAVAPKENGRNAPIKIPSFVSRQDGCELSYEVGVIIAENWGDVKRSGNTDQRKISQSCHSEAQRAVGISRYNVAIRQVLPGDCHVTPSGLLAMTYEVGWCVGTNECLGEKFFIQRKRPASSGVVRR